MLDSSNRTPTYEFTDERSHTTIRNSSSQAENDKCSQPSRYGGGHKWKILFLVAFAAVYLAGISSRPLFHPDETRYSQIPKEMLLDDHWSVPQLNGLDYFEKPILGYWIHAATMNLFGFGAQGSRLPSAASALLTGLCLVLLLHKTSRKDQSWKAATIYITLLLVSITGRMVLLDSLFTLFVTASIVLFLKSRELEKRQWLILVSAGVCAGLAFMTKGLLGFLLPAIVLGPFALWTKTLTTTLRKLPWIILGASLTPLGWCLSVYKSRPDYFEYFFWTEHVQRFISAPPSQHPEPIWYFIPVIVLATLPWVSFLPHSVTLVCKKQNTDELDKLSICWVIMPLVFFSCSSGKLATYLLPAMPAVALMIARAVDAYESGKISPRISIHLWNLLLIALGGLVIYAPDVVHLANEPFKSAILAAILWTAAGISISPLVFKNRGFLFLAMASHAVLITASLTWLLPKELLNKKAPVAFFESAKPMIPPGMAVLAEGPISTSVAWALDRNDLFILGDQGELAFGLKKQPQRAIANFDEATLARFSTTGVAVFVCKSSQSVLATSEPDTIHSNDAYVFQLWLPVPFHSPMASNRTAKKSTSN